MRSLIVLGVVGLIAQLVDGALGMAYGVTSTTLLLSGGVAPATASASVHLAEIGTTLASGTAHWRFGNISWRVVLLMTVPGAVGAFLGAVALSSLDGATAKPFVAGFLFILGLYVLLRFTWGAPRIDTHGRRLPALFLAPLGAFAGFMDAAGGGGWGPIGTPTLLASGRLEPRKVVGSVDTGEFLVAVGASAGFLASLGSKDIRVGYVAALLVGGIVAAPIAAWLVRKVPPRMLGAAVGGLILVTNAKTLSEAAGADPSVRAVIYVALAALWAAALHIAITHVRRERRQGARVATAET